jgi:hypothetical protein
MEKDTGSYKKAKKIAKKKIDFIKNFMTYGIVMGVLALINNVADQGGYQWWLWPATCWGIFVVIDFLSVFASVDDKLKRYEKRLTQREKEKMGREEYSLPQIIH